MARCTYCGLKNDPKKALEFASEKNLCHHALPAASPKLAHQNAYCLSFKHQYCPVFLLKENKPLPPNIAFVQRKNLSSQNTIYFGIGLSLFILASALIGFVVKEVYSSPANLVPRGTITINSNAPLVTITRSPTMTPSQDLSVKAVKTTQSTGIACAPPDGWTLYTLTTSDTMNDLQTIYGISVAELETANCLGNGYVFQAGDQIYVPPLLTGTPNLANLTATLTGTLLPSPTSSPRVVFYFTFTPTKEEHTAKPPTPVPPTRTPVPTKTPTPRVTTTSPVVPTPTSPPALTSLPPTATPTSMPPPTSPPPTSTPQPKPTDVPTVAPTVAPPPTDVPTEVPTSPAVAPS